MGFGKCDNGIVLTGLLYGEREATEYSLCDLYYIGRIIETRVSNSLKHFSQALQVFCLGFSRC